MNITKCFDEVQFGVSDAEAFLSRIARPIEELFGSTSLAAGVSQLFTELQQACKKVEIIVAGSKQQLVMTDTVYSSIMASLAESAKLFKLNPANAGRSRAQIIEGLIKVGLELGVPIALSIVAPGSVPIIRLAEETLSKLVPMMV